MIDKMGHLRRRPVMNLLVVAVSVAGVAAAPSPLQAPFASSKPAASANREISVACPEVPAPPVGPLGTVPRYDPADRTHSKVLEDRRVTFDRAIAPLKSYLRLVVSQAQRSASGGKDSRSAGHCAGAELASWARAGALGNGGGVNDDYVIATTLSGLAIAYLQAAPNISEPDRAVIKAWFAKRSEELRGRMDGRRNLPVYVNNHRLWVAMASAAVGVAVNSRPDFAWAMKSLKEEACAVTGAGALPAEMKRGTAALRYQVYALDPLVTLSEFAERNGVPGYEVCNAGVRRAVAFALAADAPERAQALSGSKQEPVRDASGGVSHSQFAWLYIYSRRFPVSSDWARQLESGWWGMDELGGDVRSLYAHHPAESQKPRFPK